MYSHTHLHTQTSIYTSMYTVYTHTTILDLKVKRRPVSHRKRAELEGGGVEEVVEEVVGVIVEEEVV